MHDNIICDQNLHDIRDQHPEKKPIAATLYVVLSGPDFPEFWVIELTSGSSFDLLP